MQLGEPRKAEETRQQLYENLNLSNGLGNETRIGDIMTKTGVKDTFQLHFIEWMQETYKKVGAAERKKALDESWKELQELRGTYGSMINPVWRFKGVFYRSSLLARGLTLTFAGPGAH